MRVCKWLMFLSSISIFIMFSVLVYSGVIYDTSTLLERALVFTLIIIFTLSGGVYFILKAMDEWF